MTRVGNSEEHHSTNYFGNQLNQEAPIFCQNQ